MIYINLSCSIIHKSVGIKYNFRYLGIYFSLLIFTATKYLKINKRFLKKNNLNKFIITIIKIMEF